MADTRSPTISAGRYRGRRITVPPGLDVRPTRGLVRAALFDMLGGSVDGLAVLDLYSGSGLLGLEALSRGAAHVTFVERNRRALVALRTNLATCGVPAGDFTILPIDVDDLSGSHLAPEPLDLILGDPPFPRVDALPSCLLVGTVDEEGTLPVPLDPQATLALHLPSDRPPAEVLGPWRLVRARTHGRSVIALYRAASDRAAPSSLKKS